MIFKDLKRILSVMMGGVCVIRGIKLYQCERLKILFSLLLKPSISFSSLSLKLWTLIAMETLSAHRHDNRGGGCTLKINSPNQVEIRQIFVSVSECGALSDQQVAVRHWDCTHTLMVKISWKNRWKNIEKYSTALKVRSGEIKLFLNFWNKRDENVL